MKKNIFKLMIFIMFFCCFTTGCKKEEVTYVQVTIEEIEEALSENIKDVSLEFNSAYYGYSSDENELYTNRYKLYMERQNVDTTDLMVVDRIELSGRASTEIYIFKFSNIESAINCYQNYECGENYSLQRHGNLVLMVHKDYANNIYKIIRKIK